MVEVRGGVAVKKFVVGAVIGVALISAERAHAADLSAIMAMKAPAAPAAYDWTGFYLGGHLGYALGGSNWSATQAGAATPSALRLARFLQRLQLLHGQRQLLARIAGRLRLHGRLALAAWRRDRYFVSKLSSAATRRYTLRADWPGELCRAGRILRHCARPHRLRANFAATWLFYATGGLAWSYDQFTRTQLAGVPAGGTAVPGTVENLFLVPRVGGAVGAGVELALSPNWTARLRISVHRLRLAQRHVSGRRAAVRVPILHCRRLRVGVDYKLGQRWHRSEILAPRGRQRSTSTVRAARADDLRRAIRAAVPFALSRPQQPRSEPGARKLGRHDCLRESNCGRAPNSGSIRRSIRVSA